MMQRPPNMDQWFMKPDVISSELLKAFLGYW